MNKSKKIKKGLSDAELVAKYSNGNAQPVTVIIKKMLDTKLPANFTKIAR